MGLTRFDLPGFSAEQTEQLLKVFLRVLPTLDFEFSGNVQANITGNVTGNVTGDVTGSATKLKPGSTPKNAVAAAGTVTFTDGATQGETLVIGADTYEVDIDATGVTEGNIAIALVTGSVTKEDAGAALELASAAGTADVTLVDNEDGTVTVTSDTLGVIGNAIAFSEDGAHIAVDQYNNTDFLGGTAAGVDCTIAEIGTVLFDSLYLYVAKTAMPDTTGTSWRRIALGNVF